MIDEIKIYNVEFGDCFICQDESNKMLVDFGSIALKNISTNVINDINSTLSAGNKKYLMISHFHNDHMNGIRHLARGIIFDEVYLPNFFSRAVINLQFASLVCFGRYSREGAFALRMLSLIPNISTHLSNSSIINFVKRGETIANYLDVLRVLWPDFDVFDDTANALTRELIREVRDIRELSEDEHLRNRIPMILDNIETNSNGYFNLLNEYSDNGKLTYTQDLSALSDYVQNCIEESFNGSNVIDKNLRREISKLQNEICLCFDNDNEGKRVLFLSDLPKKHYATISISTTLRLYNEYNTIKVAHHGTTRYFVYNLPQSKNLVISNGRVHPSANWPISAQYGCTYSSRSFYCTNYNCDYSLTSGYCSARANGGQCGIHVVHNLTL